MINGVQFINGYKWVDTYYNGRKVAGSQIVDVSGEMLSVPNTYDDSAYIKIFGKTVEIGEGEKSPDNPYELKSVGGDGGFDLVSCGRNLIPPFTNDYTVTFQGVTMSVLKGGQSVRVDGEFTGSSPEGRIVLRSVAGRTKLEGGVTYTFSAYHIGGTYSGISAYLNRVSDNTFIVYTNFKGTGVQITPSEDTECYIGIVLSVGAKCEDAEFVFQIEKGVSTSPYTPFRGMQTVHIPYTLRSLPDGTHDYIEIDNIAKTAKLVQAVKRVILSPNENWAMSSQDDNRTRFYFYRDLGVLGSVYNSQRCTHFQPFTSYADMSGRVRDGILFETSFFNNLVVSNNIASNVSELKTWLANNSVEINFKTTPTVTDVDYNEIKTYYPFTQIYTTATVQPTLEGKIRVWTA